MRTNGSRSDHLDKLDWKITTRAALEPIKIKVQSKTGEEAESNIRFNEGSDTVLVQNALIQGLGIKREPEVFGSLEECRPKKKKNSQVQINFSDTERENI